MCSLLTTILRDESFERTPFALLYRPHTMGIDTLEVMTGEVSYPASLREIQLSRDNCFNTNDKSKPVLTLIPYNQLRERGFDYHDDDAKLMALIVNDYETMTVQDAIKLIPNSSIELSKAGFDIDDNEYAEIVDRIINEEIGKGSGSNFVIRREFNAAIKSYSIFSVFSIFHHLLVNESGAHWVFLIHTGDRTFVGASPELHIGLKDNIARMNPISGTYRYPDTGPTLEGIMNFIGTAKEADELFMVVEEELKMVSRIFPLGGVVKGPFLREMSRLAHTEFHIEGRTSHDPRTILRETMFSPAVTGSPIENACRVIKKYESHGRGYYAGVAALIEQDSVSKKDIIDSAILIRTADINKKGQAKIGVGATIVRHSNPKAEASETHSKAAALLSAMRSER